MKMSNKNLFKKTFFLKKQLYFGLFNFFKKNSYMSVCSNWIIGYIFIYNYILIYSKCKFNVDLY